MPKKISIEFCIFVLSILSATPLGKKSIGTATPSMSLFGKRNFIIIYAIKLKTLSRRVASGRIFGHTLTMLCKATCVFDDHSSYPVDPLPNTTPVFLDDLTKTFAFILSKVGIHVQCVQSRSFLLMAESFFQLFSNWRISNRSQNHSISDYLYTWHIKTRTPMKRIGNIVILTREQVQAYNRCLESYVHFRDYQHFQNPLSN